MKVISIFSPVEDSTRITLPGTFLLITEKNAPLFLWYPRPEVAQEPTQNLLHQEYSIKLIISFDFPTTFIRIRVSVEFGSYPSISTRSTEENLIGFLAVTESTGEYLTNAILKELGKNGLDIQNCRGQGYDNGANMVDVISGVKNSNIKYESHGIFHIIQESEPKRSYYSSERYFTRGGFIV
ncbi:TTF-type domain-containing protein [Trichonephila clavipes]|nr:TTF-type domain-containing protein [Trichonephila clavipes]